MGRLVVVVAGRWAEELSFRMALTMRWDRERVSQLSVAWAGGCDSIGCCVVGDFASTRSRRSARRTFHHRCRPGGYTLSPILGAAHVALQGGAIGYELGVQTHAC